MCALDGCEKKVAARGMCSMHYRRWRVYGDPHFTMAKVGVDFDEIASPGHPEECWVWTGTIGSNGYGFWGKLLAHRVSYERNVGPIPDGSVVMHTCDNPPCYNPGHLRAGTQRENLTDMRKKGRGKSNPPRGERHPQSKITEEDVISIRSDPRPQRVIAASTGISQAHVGEIKRGESWAHVPT